MRANAIIQPEAYLTGDERILFVDDEKVISDMAKSMLERLGYQVTVRNSSTDTLEAFKTTPQDYDLVITDLTMPNMAGDKLSQKIKHIRPDIPILLCTGFSEKISEDQFAAIGINGLLMKPVTMDALSKSVRDALDRIDHSV